MRSNAMGPRGSGGTDGSKMWNGNGAPSNSIGVDGDYYLDDTSCNMYSKESGNFVLIANIKGQPGADGTVPTYTSAGLQSGYKMWFGTATTNSSGQWSANYSSAGFTVPPLVQPQAVSSANTTAGAVGSSITAPTTTSVSGACFVANPISLLGVLPLQTVGAGVVVQLFVIGK